MIYFSKSQEDFLKSTRLQVNESTSLQVYKQKRYVQIPAIRGDRNLQDNKKPENLNISNSQVFQVFRFSDFQSLFLHETFYNFAIICNNLHEINASLQISHVNNLLTCCLVDLLTHSLTTINIVNSNFFNDHFCFDE